MPVLASVTQTLTHAVSHHGVSAVFVLMAIDALLPVGGELIMVVAGAIAAGTLVGHPTLLGHHFGAGTETYIALALTGTVGYLLGSLVGWRLGKSIGVDRIERHGHLIHLGPRNMTKAERWFDRHGARAVLFGRLTPLVRSFISIPAGLFGEPLGRYTALTALGSAIWCFAFAGLGWALGSRYTRVDHVTRIIEAVIFATIAVLIAAAWRRRRRAA